MNTDKLDKVLNEIVANSELGIIDAGEISRRAGIEEMEVEALIIQVLSQFPNVKHKDQSDKEGFSIIIQSGFYELKDFLDKGGFTSLRKIQEAKDQELRIAQELERKIQHLQIESYHISKKEAKMTRLLSIIAIGASIAVPLLIEGLKYWLDHHAS